VQKCHVFFEWPQVSISPTFYDCLFRTKVLCTAFLYLQFGFVIFWCKNIGAKAARKTLLKLIIWVNFIKFLCKAFLRTDPKGAKKTVKLSIFFALWGSSSVKALHKMLMKWTLVQFVPKKKHIRKLIGKKKESTNEQFSHAGPRYTSNYDCQYYKTGGPRYMQSFHLRFHVYAIEK